MKTEYRKGNHFDHSRKDDIFYYEWYKKIKV